MRWNPTVSWKRWVATYIKVMSCIYSSLSDLVFFKNIILWLFRLLTCNNWRCNSKGLHLKDFTYTVQSRVALSIKWSGRNTTKRGIQGLQLFDIIIGEYALLICILVLFIWHVLIKLVTMFLFLLSVGPFWPGCWWALKQPTANESLCVLLH